MPNDSGKMINIRINGSSIVGKFFSSDFQKPDVVSLDEVHDVATAPYEVLIVVQLFVQFRCLNRQ